MATLTYPGVYVQEISGGVRPIQAAGTSTAAFIGQAEKGLLTEAKKIFNFTEFQAEYGGFLPGSFLAHAVFQFFNNGGSECYVVRVTGSGAQPANIALNDRAVTSQVSLTISANSPGVWGNDLAVEIKDGPNDPGNEFSVLVYKQGTLTPLETLSNLSIVPGRPNYVETATSSSQYIRVTVNIANTNAAVGISKSADAPLALNVPSKTQFQIDVNGDGYQEIDLQDAVDDGTVADLSTVAHITTAIQHIVRGLTAKKSSTNQNAFNQFTSQVGSGADAGKLVLSSGVTGAASSINVSPAQDLAKDASGLLKLGKLNGGMEILGGAVTRPRVNPTSSQPPNNFYLVGDNQAGTTEVVTVQLGSDGAPITTDQPYLEGFNRLNDKNDFSLLAVPGIGSPPVVGAGMNYCGNRSLSDVFFIGDMSQDDDTITEAQTFAAAISPKNSYGAVYLPWVKTIDPTGQSPDPILVPPSGFIAGLFARTDTQRGVWKAPAGTSAALGGAIGLRVDFTDVQQGNLNPRNINCIRNFPTAGIVSWGARTITADPEWLYIPVRRMGIFLRISIYHGLQWVVFEPNDEPLWAQIRINVGAFMHTLYRQGAFQGQSPKEAYLVKCDKETTTQSDIDAGVVNILVGFAPLKPAEFVFVRIQQKAGQIPT